MSHIQDLINEHCPNGVEFKTFDEILVYEQPTKYLVASTNYDDSYSVPVLTAGQTFILGYTDETAGVFPATHEKPVIIFDDFTTASKWVDFPFKAKSSAMKILTLADNRSVYSLRYVYHFMQTIRFAPRSHARHWIATYSKFRIPVPPLEVQREIVRILDGFTKLEARRKQYAFYRDQLLTFTPEGGELNGRN